MERCAHLGSTALTPATIDIESGVASIETLKRRKRGTVRQVPLPLDLLDELNIVFGLALAQRNPELASKRIWSFSRSTAWRYVKRVMRVAGVTGTPAMPKGLRHAFGVKCLSIERAAASRSALARSCLASDDFYIWQRDRSRGTRLRRADVESADASALVAPHNVRSRK